MSVRKAREKMRAWLSESLTPSLTSVAASAAERARTAGAAGLLLRKSCARWREEKAGIMLMHPSQKIN